MCSSDLRMYTAKHGLPDENLYQIQQDDTGKLWIGCNLGLIVIDPEEFEKFDAGRSQKIACTVYDTSHGVRHTPILFGAIKRGNGELWFHGEKGVTIVDPTRLNVNSHIPETRLESLKVNRTPVSIAGTLEIAPGQGDWEFDYSGLSLTAPEQVRFRYKLEGFDKEWVEAGERRSAFYTNLPPNDYRFLVKSCNEDGIWSLNTTKIGRAHV